MLFLSLDTRYKIVKSIEGLSEFSSNAFDFYTTLNSQ
jgi:hypothetical protein